MGAKESCFKRLAPMLMFLLAVVAALAQGASRTYSNIVINVVTSTNAVNLTDLQGHTYSNVTVKLIPYGLAWYAKDGSEGRLAITNLDEVTLADITGLSTNQAAYLIHKKSMEDTDYIPQEATDSTSWWLAPYPYRLDKVVLVNPEGNLFIPPIMHYPMMYGQNEKANEDMARKELQRLQEKQDRAMQEMQERAMQGMQWRGMQEMQGRAMQEMRSYSPGHPVFTKP
jgi:hypothetical protein